MRTSLSNSNRHLNLEDLRLLKKEVLPIEENIKAMAHIGVCDLCAASFAACFDDKELVVVAPDFSGRVLKKISKSLEEPKKQKTKESQKKELYFFTARVSLAMCLTLMLFFSGTFSNITRTFEADKINRIDLSGMNAFSETIRTFSNKIIQVEVTKNDQKKK